MIYTIGQEDAPRSIEVETSPGYVVAHVPEGTEPGPERRLEWSVTDNRLCFEAVAGHLLHAAPGSSIVALISGDMTDVGNKLFADRSSASAWTHGRRDMPVYRRALALWTIGFKFDGLIWTYPEN
jgi:hypothetical protein